MSQNDQRSERTRRALGEALVELLHHKPYDDITVDDIARQAMVNRATFYRHYPGKTDLTDELVQRFRESFIDLLHRRYPGDIRRFLRESLDNLHGSRRLLWGLLQIDNRRHHLERDLRAVLREQYLISVPPRPGDDRALQADLFAGVLLTNLRHYVGSDSRFTYEQAVGQLQQVTRYLVG